ncbi:non-ribosomal peptide synthetase [Acanthopleuribacter pedis]|uniref:Amino acid adenylation domain-containing protein n=1 Tax=Acanthopleuribacter pedis TaxID=442870 RepID=A0A8J7U1Z6_9BACT|nr:non-ribosomal peptide synthetase [Acanthopleuribacter pedis]MBO1318738.1 amino acid adenylation domain-containing protein [Acanthopleuribacter pedis]
MRKELDDRTAQLSGEKRRLLALRLQGRSGDAGAALGTAATPGETASAEPPTHPEAPLSPPQKRLWFLDRFAGAGAAYHVMAAWRLDGVVDPAALDRAFCKLIARQSALRTGFPFVDGEPRQVLGPVPKRILQTRAATGTALGEWCRQELNRPFDVAAGPLLRVTLLQIEPSRSLLVLCAHHLIIDGWSVALLHRELDLFYQGRGHELPPLVDDYLAISTRWDHALRAGELDRQRDYWVDQLKDGPTLHNLSLDKPRPARPGYRGARHCFDLGRTRRRALQQLAGAQAVGMFSAMNAVFVLLLHKLSGRDDLVVGVPFAGRTEPARQPLIGFFVNTLALRFQLDRDTPFLTLLQQARDLTLAGSENGEIPFDQVVEAVAPPRDGAVSPLVQIMFAYQTEPETATNLGDIPMAPFAFDADTAQVDLTLTVTETTQGGWVADYEYSTDLFCPATIAAMARQLTTLLDACLDRPTATLAALSPLAPSEIPVLCRPHHPLPTPNATEGLHDLVFQAANRDPDAVAVHDAGVSLTYQELCEQARRVAHALRAMGVRADHLVGVYLPTTITRVPAVLGILAAGGAFLPLDSTNPNARLADILTDACPRVVVGRDLPPPLAAMLDQAGISLLDPDRLGPDGACFEPPATHPEQAAYVIYTSGSTGRPKGVVVPHRAAAHYTAAMVRRFGTRPGDRLPRFANFGFDVAVEDIFVTLAAGATLVGTAHEALDIPALPAWTETQKITLLSLPTAFWRALTEAFVAGSLHLPASVRLVVIGGESLPPADLAKWRRHLGDRITLINAYGPTETTVSSAMATVAGPNALATDLLEGRAEVPIGRAVADNQLLVVDQHRNPAPLGVPGELWIGGPTVARGYLGDPRRTAEAFVPHPLATKPGERFYRTGDRVRHLPCGDQVGASAVYSFQGRIDRQLKLRGFRVEPGEIEAALQRQPGVAHAVVLPVGDTALAAHWVASPRSTATSETLKKDVRAHLPAYMVPRIWHQWPALPMHNGKLDRNAVRAASLPTGPHADQPSRIPPRNMLEFQLHRLWTALLDQGVLGVTDDFFAAGGHSLLAVRFMTRVRQQWGAHLSLEDFLKNPTIAGCAAALQQAGTKQAFSYLVPLKSEGRRAPLFCVHPQRGQVLSYAALARSFDSDHPFIAVQASGPECGEPVADLEKMACSYWEAIQVHHPAGPILLAGWSFGGVVAHHIAGIAEAEGREVTFLGLFDSEVPTQESRRDSDIDLLVRLLGKNGEASRPTLANLTPEERVPWAVAQGLQHPDLSAFDDRAGLVRLLQTLLAHNTAWQQYRPKPIMAPIDFYKAGAPDADDRAWRPPNPEADWRDLTRSGLTVRTLPCSHMNLMQPPFVQQLSQAVADRLSACPVL